MISMAGYAQGKSRTATVKEENCDTLVLQQQLTEANQKIEQLEQKNNELNNSINECKKTIEKLQANNINALRNIKNQTIFTSEFPAIDILEDINNVFWYSLIKTIREMAALINATEQKHTNVQNANELLKTGAASQSTINTLHQLGSEIRDNIQKIGVLNETVKSFNREEKNKVYSLLLSENQKDYYNDLVKRYYKLIEEYR